MNILLPTTVTGGMVKEGTTIPEVDTDFGEVLWTPGAHTEGESRVYGDSVYYCVKTHTSTSASPKPPNDGKNWLFERPTNRMAPFDEYIYTKSIRNGELTVVLEPGFFTGFGIYGAESDFTDVKLREAPGSEVLLLDETVEMWEQAFGEWEYLFGNLRRETKLTRASLPIRPSSRLEVTLRRSDPEVPAELGTLVVGQWHTLFAPNTQFGGTQYGVEVTPKSYSFFRRNEDGTYTRSKGRQAKLIEAEVLISAAEAPRVSDLLQQILDIPVAVEASDLPQYGHISTFGFVTGTVTSATWNTARVRIKVDGNV